MVKVALRPSTSADQFDFTWFDLATGQESAKGRVGGGGVQRFEAPVGFPAQLQPTDWLLWVKRRP